MKYLIPILLFITCSFYSFRKGGGTMVQLKRDTVPSGVPQLFGGKYYKFNGYVLVDSFIMNAAGDTNNVPYFPSLKFKSSNNKWYGWDRSRWRAFAYETDPITANNGLTYSSGNIQFGQTISAGGNPAALVHNTEIPLNGFNTVFTGTGTVGIGLNNPSSGTSLDVLSSGINNAIKATSATGVAINATSVSGNGIVGASNTTGFGVQGRSNGGYGIFGSGGINGIGGRLELLQQGGSSDNIMLDLSLLSTGSGIANGAGYTIAMRNTLTSGASNIITGKIKHYLSNATAGAYSSELEFHLANNTTLARKALLSHTGQWTWDGYPSLSAQADTSTYKPIAIDGSGNVVKMQGWSSGAHSLDEVLAIGNTGYNKDIFLQDSKPSQAVIAVYNRDTTNDNAVARVDARAYRGKAVLTCQGGSHSFNGFQIYRFTQSPGSYLPYTDSAKTVEIFQNPDIYSVPQMRNGLQLAFVHPNYEVKLLSFDTVGRAGFANIEDPQAWIDLPSNNGAGTASLRLRPGSFSSNTDAGAINNTGTYLTYTDNSHNTWSLNDQCRNADDGSISTPSHSFANDHAAGMSYSNVTHSPVISANTSGEAVGIVNTNSGGYAAFTFYNSTHSSANAFVGYNNANSRFRIGANAGFSIDFEAGGFNDNDPTMRLTYLGGVYMKTLVGTGNRIVTTDAGGNLSASLAVAAGTYTPTITSVANVSATTAYACQYMRVGNTVTVSGKVDIDPTAIGQTTIGISLPISSALTNDFQSGGTGSCGTQEGLQGAISADATNDRAQLDFVIPAAGSIANNSWFFSFTYQVL